MRIKTKYTDQHPEWKTRVSSSLRWLTLQLTESLSQDIRDGSFKPSTKALALAITLDKNQLLRGKPSRISEVNSAPKINSINEALNTLDDLEPTAGQPVAAVAN
jgi:hypothetical protein